jgi:hypothetical protein
MDGQFMINLPVKALPSNDSGRLLVRLNANHRPGIPRYGIAKLTNLKTSRSIKVLCLGHDDASAIFMPYDIREALGVNKSDDLDFTITKVGRVGAVLWLLNTPDPAVNIPAWMALASVVLGCFGILFALFI